MIHEDNGPVFPVVIFPENIRKIIVEANSFKAKAHLFMADGRYDGQIRKYENGNGLSR